MYKQIIIARKDLDMSPGKLAAQVSHASMAFLTSKIKRSAKKVINEHIGRAWTSSGASQFYMHPGLNEFAKIARQKGKSFFIYKPKDAAFPNGEQMMCDKTTVREYKTAFPIEKDLYEQWICGEFTKCVLRAKNKSQLLKAKRIAEEMGMKENEDFWLIRDNCHTELESEEDGKTLTCIGFKPMDSELIDKIGKKYQLY